MTDRPPTDKPTEDGETGIYISLPLNIVPLFVVGESRCGSEKNAEGKPC